MIHSHSLVALAYHLGLVRRCRRHRCHARDTKRIDYVALGGDGGGWGRRRGRRSEQLSLSRRIETKSAAASHRHHNPWKMEGAPLQ